MGRGGLTTEKLLAGANLPRGSKVNGLARQGDDPEEYFYVIPETKQVRVALTAELIDDLHREAKVAGAGSPEMRAYLEQLAERLERRMRGGQKTIVCRVKSLDGVRAIRAPGEKKRAFEGTSGTLLLEHRDTNSSLVKPALQGLPLNGPLAGLGRVHRSRVEPVS